jgi:integrating conjugative element protein (TIGR03746 family)
VRALQLVPGHGFEESKVVLTGEDSWTVTLDMELIETAYGMTVKNPVIRYPLRVVRYEVDPELNPWGLALDGYSGRPERVTLTAAGDKDV